MKIQVKYIESQTIFRMNKLTFGKLQKVPF
uniref:Uncharacterized protein n=1 Tax=Myoviridae sp. ctqMr7 TaxID=2823552 RepID=A0A8S5LHG2_9CAUD|nr:MAG TPA: hypothetical protein [Myoviridae sp. ctqMr7]DAO10266.1 MAG TPA: hypothetical protein [Caudoviricetes sp.]DAX79401.1 MAG TPA: hypothetical protein [Caudoviricetes sp.]